MVNIPINLPGGPTLNGNNVVVIVGPNGSGKSRLARQLTSPGYNIEIVSASRSTRISPNLPVMSNLQARQQHDGQRNQAKSNPWEQISDFDFVLAQLLSDDSDSARLFRAAAKAGEPTAAIPKTALEQVEEIWQEVFEGRTLSWKDWAASVKNENVPLPEYSANQMSDGERSALYLTAKVMLTSSGSVLVVDEPETHFHSSLAVRLWKSLQARRDDLRFVFVTHDLTFATAQSGAVFLIAGATSRLEVLPIESSLPGDLKRDILGAASFSYYASRVVFCEGTFESYDYQLFNAWFSGRDTVVAPVGSCDSVRECVRAIRNGALMDNLTSIGIIDRDFRPDSFFQHLESSVCALKLHEIEGIVCLPGVVNAIAGHLGRDLPAPLIDIIRGSINDATILRVAYERWKTSMLNELQGRITSKPAKPWTEQSLRTHSQSPHFAGKDISGVIFDQELNIMQSTAASNEVEVLLATFPCKPIAGAIASALNESVSELFALVSRALSANTDSPLFALGQSLEKALELIELPERTVEARS